MRITITEAARQIEAQTGLHVNRRHVFRKLVETDSPPIPVYETAAPPIHEIDDTDIPALCLALYPDLGTY